MRISDIKLNDGTQGLPKNPRFIRDGKFKKLCDSVRDNPEFMPARPIIVDEAGTILGGNMRYRACEALGMAEIPDAWVQRVAGWTIEKKRRFIILDNRGFGEDDEDILANEWDLDELIAAGMTEADMGIFDPESNPDEVTKGTPESQNDNLLATHEITVRFIKEADKIKFGLAAGVPCTEATKAIWWPEKPEAVRDQVGA